MLGRWSSIARCILICRRAGIARHGLPTLAQGLVDVGSFPRSILLHVHQVLWQLSKLPQHLQSVQYKTMQLPQLRYLELNKHESVLARGHLNEDARCVERHRRALVCPTSAVNPICPGENGLCKRPTVLAIIG